MKIIKCDRCGKYICCESNKNGRSYKYFNQIVVAKYTITKNDCGEEQEIDLCPDCLNDLAEFLTKKEEEEEPPPDVIIAKNLQEAAKDGINVIKDTWNNVYGEKTCKNCSNAGTIFSFMCEFCNLETHSHFKKKKE